MNDRDRELTRRMLAGDEPSFDEFFDGYFPVLYRFALARMGQDPDGAEEVVQAALCKAISKLGTYRGEAALLTWLCTFCRHEISAFFERSGRDRRGVVLSEEIPEVAAALQSLASLADDGPEASLRRKEIMRLVHVTLDLLPIRYADALEWKYIEGLQVREIATRLALSEKAAESLLTRAREAFRDGFATLSSGRSAWGPLRTETP